MRTANHDLLQAGLMSTGPELAMRRNSGPTKVVGPQHYRGLDGRWHHIVRQSDVNRFRQCPELHRRHLLADVDDWQNDSAAIGTAFAVFTDGVLTHGDSDMALGQAETELQTLWASPNLRTVQIYGGLAEAMVDLHHLTKMWVSEVLPQFPPNRIVGVEVPFLHVIEDNPSRVISIQGTRDLDCTAEIVDWKTGNKGYSGRDAWKHQRYDVQPVMYSWARQLGETDQHNSPALKPFRYVVIHRDPQGPKDAKRFTDELPIEVTWGQVDFLRMEIEALCRLVEAELPLWPLGPTDWHCSNKWCPAWSTCRGKHQGDDPWGLMANVELQVKQYANPFKGIPNGSD